MTGTAEPTAPARRGFCCPRCGRKLTVEDTKKPCANKIVRYRKCAGCGHKIVTVEKPR